MRSGDPASVIVNAMVRRHYADVPNVILLTMINEAIAPEAITMHALRSRGNQFGIAKSAECLIQIKQMMSASAAKRCDGDVRPPHYEGRIERPKPMPADAWFGDDPRAGRPEPRFMRQPDPLYSPNGNAAAMCAI